MSVAQVNGWNRAILEKGGQSVHREQLPRTRDPMMAGNPGTVAAIAPRTIKHAGRLRRAYPSRTSVGDGRPRAPISADTAHCTSRDGAAKKMRHCELLAAAVGTLSCGLGGCTLALDLDASQCVSTSDCLARGLGFADTVCSQGSCKHLANPVGPETPDASSETALLADPPSTNLDPGSGSPGEPELSGGSGNSAAHASNTGVTTPGGFASPENFGVAGCATTERCVTDHQGEAYLCRHPGAPCLPLTTAECPLVIGDLQSDNPVLFGALLQLSEPASAAELPLLNLELALDEFNAAGGLPNGPRGELQPLAAVVCRSQPDAASLGMQHLIQDVQATAVVADLPSAELKSLFVEPARLRFR